MLKERFYALDVFRGATVCLMILVNNPGSWGHIFAPLEHAPWHGLTPTDLVFPFFLFAVGNAFSFVMPRLRAGGAGAFWKKVIRRSLLIFAIGLFLNWWPFVKWEDGALVFKQWVDPLNPEFGIRIFGVLQRIAVCYFFAAIILFYTRPRMSFYITAILLLGYWVLCILGNPADPYSLEGWFGTAIDKAILHVPHMYKGEGIPFDPEGLMSTIPAIAEVIFGYLIGSYIQEKGKNEAMLNGLFVAAVALMLAGYAWGQSFPINKKIWTSSYTLLTSGLATLCIATMIWFIELKKRRGMLTRFFDVFGKNALFVFALSAFLPKMLALIRIHYTDSTGEAKITSPWSWMYNRIYIHMPGRPELGSLLFALTVILFMWAICYWMDKKKIYVKV